MALFIFTIFFSVSSIASNLAGLAQGPITTEQSEQNSSLVLHQDNVDFNELLRQRVPSIWENHLVNLVSEDLRNCTIEYLNSGAQGSVFMLKQQTGRILKTLKMLKSIKSPEADRTFNPLSGPHLFLGINHRSICSPTHIFYLTSPDVVSLTPGPRSEYFALIMPYVEGDQLSHAMHKVVAKAENLFNFGLLLAEAIYELSQQGIQHGDIGPYNILVNDKLEPIIIDPDSARKISTVSVYDYLEFHWILKYLLIKSKDIKLEAKTFLINSLCYANIQLDPVEEIPQILSDDDLRVLPKYMIALMRACIENLNAIKSRSDEPFVPERLESSIKIYLN